MANRTLTILLQNVGNVAWTFYLTAGVSGTLSGTECAMVPGGGGVDFAQTNSVTLNLGETSAPITWAFDDSAVGLPTGTNYAYSFVYRDAAFTQCVTGASTAFDIVQDINAQITSIIVT